MVAHPETVSVVVSVTVCVPAVEYTTPVGLCDVAPAGVAPAPKFHNQFTPIIVPVLLKLTGRPVHCGAVELNELEGVELMTMVSVIVCVQFWSEIVKVTNLIPEEL